MKKKLLALIMAAAVVTGLGTYGTYAYFTDQHTLNEKVNITMGTLDIDAWWANDGIAKWTPTSQATEVVALDNGDTLSFENVKPGDTFERDALIVNYGSLNSDVELTLNAHLDGNLKVELVDVHSNNYYEGVTVDPNNPNKYSVVGVEPGDFIRATIKITVPETMTSESMKYNFNADAHEFIYVTANQTIN